MSAPLSPRSVVAIWGVLRTVRSSPGVGTRRVLRWTRRAGKDLLWDNTSLPTLEPKLFRFQEMRLTAHHLTVTLVPGWTGRRRCVSVFQHCPFPIPP